MSRTANAAIQDEIIKYCREHQDAPKSQIAEDLKIRINTLNEHLKPLYADGSLTRRWVFDHSKHWKHKYRVDIKINPRQLLENDKISGIAGKWDTTNPQEQLAHYILDNYEYKEDENGVAPDIFVEDIAVLLGDAADLSILVRAKKPDYLYPFITKELRCIEGIENTNTCSEAWSASAERQQKKNTKSASSGPCHSKG